jgi:hypothetical protein
VRWRRDPTVLWRSAPGFLALGTVDGRTRVVEGPGHDVWSLLDDWVAEDDLAESLAGRYGTGADSVLADLRVLLGQLHEDGLVQRDG